MRSAWLLLVCVASGCSSDEAPPPPAGGSCTAPQPEKSGEATYYDADGTGNCSFDASTDRMVAAINAADYDHAAWCGACLVVSGPAGDIVVRVVDQCPGCAEGDLDLSREAFEMIAPLSAGRVPITWLPVPCEVDGPISYQFKDGSNAFWTAIQIRNHRYPIAKLEARDGSGAYQALPRADYNYFVDDTGLGDGPYALRVTDTRGHVLEDMAIALGDNVARTGSAQFPLCP
ncbi:MAG TPA: expansin EXLX1 family cellulose-binding protein [Kofleriaceae bacterium]|nr:expansin EXLX1 family cellulose-binding protein [Kofleriaceae bacterium]